jgi:hypothetical protein
MANASQQGNKAPHGRTKAPGVSSPQNAKGNAKRSIKALKSRGVSAADEVELIEAADQLATAMVHYADLRLGAESAGRQSVAIERAYSRALKAVPKSRRSDLLQQLKQGLDEVAKSESLVTPSRSRIGSRKSPTSSEFIAGLERQSLQQRQADQTAQRLLSGAQMRERLGVTAQSLSAALKARRMFVLQGARGEFLYPAFFCDQSFDRTVLEKVSKALGDLPGAAKWNFFTTPRISLGGKSPLDALAKGKLEAVWSAANAFREE